MNLTPLADPVSCRWREHSAGNTESNWHDKSSANLDDAITAVKTDKTPIKEANRHRTVNLNKQKELGCSRSNATRVRPSGKRETSEPDLLAVWMSGVMG